MSIGITYGLGMTERFIKVRGLGFFATRFGVQGLGFIGKA